MNQKRLLERESYTKNMRPPHVVVTGCMSYSDVRLFLMVRDMKVGSHVNLSMRQV
jgi:hypothetical protein